MKITTHIPPLKIGDTVFRFDQNRRVYKDGQSGPIYSGHFVRHEIIGETTISWILNYGAKAKKKDLTGPIPFEGARVYFTPAQMMARVWVVENRRKIADAFDRCQDAKIMRKVAELLGAEVRALPELTVTDG